ncbi:MAG: hypothetical protein HGB18_02365 [Candidatus Moranbacteria bacterium]|nr:hypothetical protein [Candidatus Moranbacteria bacterium]
MTKRKIGIGAAMIAIPAVASLLVAGQASAFGFGDGGSRSGNRVQSEERDGRGPVGGFRSEEAVSACSGKSSGDDCSFSMTRPGQSETTSVSGTCRNVPAGKTDSSESLSCMPTPKDGDGSMERVRSEDRDGRAENLKERKQAEINRIETRVQKIIDFLKSKDVDTATIEGYFSTFKAKADTVIAKVEALQTLLSTDNPSESDLASARTAVRDAGKDMISYYKDTLRTALKSALDALND